MIMRKLGGMISWLAVIPHITSIFTHKLHLSLMVLFGIFHQKKYVSLDFNLIVTFQPRSQFLLAE